MSLSSQRMMMLMAYADGELAGAERDEVEALLASDEDALRFVSQVGGLGAIVRGLHAEGSSRIESFDVASAVMAKVEAAPPASKRGEVAGGRAGRGVDVASLEEARARRVSRFRAGGGIVAVLALAAAVFLVARDKETPMAKAVAPAPAAVSNGNGAGVEVEAVESSGHSVSVYYLPSSNELSTSVVVWVDETGEK